MSVFGNEIKRIRQNKKLSLKKVGERGGISHAYVSQIENTKRNPPKPEMIKKLADSLNVSYIQLLESADYVTEKDLLEYHNKK